MRDVWGERGWGNIGLGGSAVFLHSVCASKNEKLIFPAFGRILVLVAAFSCYDFN